jgi:hypothetical protein
MKGLVSTIDIRPQFKGLRQHRDPEGVYSGGIQKNHGGTSWLMPDLREEREGYGTPHP